MRDTREDLPKECRAFTVPHSNQTSLDLSTPRSAPTPSRIGRLSTLWGSIRRPTTALMKKKRRRETERTRHARPRYRPFPPFWRSHAVAAQRAPFRSPCVRQRAPRRHQHAAERLRDRGRRRSARCGCAAGRELRAGTRARRSPTKAVRRARRCRGATRSRSASRAASPSRRAAARSAAFCQIARVTADTDGPR